MRDFFVRRFIKDHENVRSPGVRAGYGKLAGAAGLVSNLALCAAKISAGALSGSIAMIADGVNSLSDAASSAMLIVGFRIAAAPGDRQHPYGHARMEYLLGLFISIGIVLIGARLLLGAIDRIRHPEPVDFSVALLVVLGASILVKVWQALMFIRLGKAIGSSTLKASGTDSRNDVASTAAVLASILVGHFTGLLIDGYMGCAVAVFIVVSGARLVKETSDPLLGRAPDPALVKDIEGMICGTDGVIGMHDLAVHDYGPGRVFASVHAEVDAHGDFMKSHETIDGIEREAAARLGVELVIHMDPVDLKDPLTIELKGQAKLLADGIEGVSGIHDLRVVRGYAHTNVVFDVLLSPSCPLPQDEIRRRLSEGLRRLDPSYNAVITFDMDFSG
ncbi:MAG: cation diffusion facilitator family transporter [Clostridiales Family XIII bacterium]|jgi:cation diffusion facilitator family transporter|nr:cation diffusion facilitator family transporter [Clostridiales Family XIII bacterium]